MPIPITPRKVRRKPNATYFKPAGIPLRNLEEVILTFDEVEALRLKNSQKLHQKNASQKMGVSASTFQRILANAYAKITNALVEGKAIRIEGGVVKFR